MAMQLEVFDRHREEDEENLPGAKGVDLNSPLDVFHAIYNQVRLYMCRYHFPGENHAYIFKH